VEAAAAEFFASPRGQGREAFPPERWARAAPSAPPARAGRMETGLGGAAAPFLPAPAAAGESVTPPRAVQVLSAYIIAECPEGLVLIDQHALHEKVLYERILRGLRSGDLPSQRLLLPEVVRLPPHDAPAMEAIVERLRPFGFELAPFGESEIAIHAVPVILDRAPAAAVVLEAAAACREHPAGAGAAGPVDELLRRIASLMACKQAVKAGTRLDPAEIQALLADSDLAADPRYCPHGRPTSILLRREEIDRRFDRKG
jgi:DNA mismatch repair protein MutL